MVVFCRGDNLDLFSLRCVGSAVNSEATSNIFFIARWIFALTAKESEPDYYQINLSPGCVRMTNINHRKSFTNAGLVKKCVQSFTIKVEKSKLSKYFRKTTWQ